MKSIFVFLVAAASVSAALGAETAAVDRPREGQELDSAGARRDIFSFQAPAKAKKEDQSQKNNQEDDGPKDPAKRLPGLSAALADQARGWLDEARASLARLDFAAAYDQAGHAALWAARAGEEEVKARLANEIDLARETAARLRDRRAIESEFGGIEMAKRLAGILWSGDRFRALVDGAVLEQGEVIDAARGLRLAQVWREGVVVEYRGHRFQVPFGVEAE